MKSQDSPSPLTAEEEGGGCDETRGPGSGSYGVGEVAATRASVSLRRRGPSSDKGPRAAPGDAHAAPASLPPSPASQPRAGDARLTVRP